MRSFRPSCSSTPAVWWPAPLLEDTTLFLVIITTSGMVILNLYSFLSPPFLLLNLHTEYSVWEEVILTSTAEFSSPSCSSGLGSSSFHLSIVCGHFSSDSYWEFLNAKIWSLRFQNRSLGIEIFKSMPFGKNFLISLSSRGSRNVYKKIDEKRCWSYLEVYDQIYLWSREVK